MQAVTFVTPALLPVKRAHHSCVSKTRKSEAPAMTLLSHEKLEVLSDSDDVQVAKYRLELEISARLSKEKRKQTIQSMKQHANFPGFRKGTLPPYVMKDLDKFILQDATNDVIEEAMTELDISKLDGDESEPEMDLEEMINRFSSGDDFTFTCELQAKQVSTEKDIDQLDEIVSTEVAAEKVEMFKDADVSSAA